MTETGRIWVRGAGELASGAAWVLHRVGFSVILSELPTPLAIRRTVTFSDAILYGQAYVEGAAGVRAEPGDVEAFLKEGRLPVLIDDPAILLGLKPDILVDARMLKRSDGDLRGMANFTVGIGPGFDAGSNCHAVIETQRGHDLGRVIWSGAAMPDTRTPGELGGESKRRVLYAPSSGRIVWNVDFGTIVEEGQVLGTIDGNVQVHAPFHGVVRGLISPEVEITPGLKIADVDPRAEEVNYRTISDKARSVGRGVLEAVLVHLNENGGR